MQRRSFLKYAGITGAATAALGVGFYYTSTLHGIIVNILESDLKDLKIEKDAIAKFAKDATDLNPWGYSTTKIKFIAAYSKIDFKMLPLPYKYKYKQYRADIVGRFLLSTNFFHNKMDETKEIKYMGAVHTPYNYTCYNPFSNMYYPS